MTTTIENKVFTHSVRKFYNKSNFWLLPMTLLPIYSLQNIFGCFYKCELDILGGKMCSRVYVVIESKFITEAITNLCSTFIKNINIDNSYSILVYKIPVDLITDYKMYIEGKYSLFSPFYKKLIVNTYNISNALNSKTKHYYAVLYPNKQHTDKLKKQLNVKENLIEISSKPNIMEETFTVSKLYELKNVNIID